MVVVPEPYPTECYCWGSGSGGVLGKNIKVQLTPKSFKLPTKRIDSVFAGDRRTIVRTDDGGAYSWGSDPLGRKSTPTNKSVAKKMNIGPILKVSHGDMHSVFIDTEGRAFSYGDASDGKLGIKNKRRGNVELPKKVQLTEKCKDVACGITSSTLLLDSGHVIMFGLTGGERKGQPYRLQLPVKIVSVASGASHCAAISADGNLFTWGLTQNGRLGHEHDISTEMISTPTCVNYFVERKLIVSMVSSGSAHTAIVTDSGELYTFGWNCYYQCGKNFDTDCFLPNKVQGCVQGILKVSCGFAHTAFISESGQLYCFGFNEDGQLGLGHETNTADPTQVVFNGSQRTGLCVLDISCGKLHTSAVVAHCTHSEFRLRQDEIKEMKNAIRVLQRLSRQILLRKRLQSLIRNNETPIKFDESEVANTSDDHSSSQSAGDIISDQSFESFGSLDFSPRNNPETKIHVIKKGPSHMAEIMAMEGEEDLSAELSRRLNNRTNKTRRKQLNIMVELLRRHEACCFYQEHFISDLHRKLNKKAAQQRVNQRRKNQVGEMHNTVKKGIKKAAKKPHIIIRELPPKPVQNGKRSSKSTNNCNYLVHRKSMISPPPTKNKSFLFPSKSKNKKLLENRSRRLKRIEHEKRKVEEHKKILKEKEVEQLRELENAKKRHLVTKVRQLKSIINIERRKNSRELSKLHNQNNRIKSNVDENEKNLRPKTFKNVRQWTRNYEVS